MPHTSRRGFSVRTRITAGVATLTAACLVVVGVALYLVENQRIERTVQSALLQEVEEFSGYASAAAAGVTPEAIVTGFLTHNAPDAREILWSFPPDGTPQFTGDPDPRLQGSAAFRDAVTAMLESGGTRSITIDGNRYRLVVQPVTDGTTTAAFVVTHDVTAARADLRSLLTTYGLLAALALLLITGIAARLSSRLLRPLHDLGTTARSVAAGDLKTRLDVVGHDDVADLQRTFNTMLDRVDAAFDEQRRLLDDAAHELRTPLTVLRGHLEVVDAADRHDVEDTRALLLDEIDRMARLVNDLLMLARSRRPDFVRLEDVEVATLVTGVLERARGLGDRVWTVEGTSDVTAHVDAQRITQALLQLADNAVRHTREGDTIAFGASRVGDDLHLRVRDTGVGIDASVAESLFERFTRAERDDTGFGLGLSIVHAIALAHGGDVRAERLDVGTLMTVIVPLTTTPPEES